MNENGGSPYLGAAAQGGRRIDGLRMTNLHYLTGSGVAKMLFKLLTAVFDPPLQTLSIP